MRRVEIGYFQDTLRQPANKCNVFVKTVLVLKLQNGQHSIIKHYLYSYSKKRYEYKVKQPMNILSRVLLHELQQQQFKF